MSLMDTTDGLFMNLAYGWAFFNPVRKVYYNLAITGLSVAICFFIGGIETLGLLPAEIHGLSHDHGFWASWSQLQHQHGRVRHRRDVHRHLGWRPCSSGAAPGSRKDGAPASSPPLPTSPLRAWSTQ